MSINIGPAASDDLGPKIMVIGVGGAGGGAGGSTPSCIGFAVSSCATSVAFGFAAGLSSPPEAAIAMVAIPTTATPAAMR